MVKKIIMIILAALIAGLFLAYFFFPNQSYHLFLKAILPESPTILISDIHKLNHPVFLDTRSIDEFNVSHIQGARWVGFEDFSPEKVTDIPKDTAIILYCSVGYRSGKITQQLSELGYTHVESLFGGIFEWKNEGNMVFDSTGPTETVHVYDKYWGIWLRGGEKVY